MDLRTDESDRLSAHSHGLHTARLYFPRLVVIATYNLQLSKKLGCWHGCGDVSSSAVIGCGQEDHGANIFFGRVDASRPAASTVMAAIKDRKRRRSRPRPVTGQLRSSNARPPPSDSKSYLSASSATPGPSPCSSTYDPHHAQAPRCKLLVMNRSFARRPTPHHVFRHRRLGDLKAKHQQLAMDPRCSPPWVFLAHPSDEIAQLSIDLWPPCPLP